FPNSLGLRAFRDCSLNLSDALVDVTGGTRIGFSSGSGLSGGGLCAGAISFAHRPLLSDSRESSLSLGDLFIHAAGSAGVGFGSGSGLSGGSLCAGAISFDLCLTLRDGGGCRIIFGDGQITLGCLKQNERERAERKGHDQRRADAQ